MGCTTTQAVTAAPAEESGEEYYEEYEEEEDSATNGNEPENENQFQNRIGEKARPEPARLTALPPPSPHNQRGLRPLPSHPPKPILGNSQQLVPQSHSLQLPASGTDPVTSAQGRVTKRRASGSQLSSFKESQNSMAPTELQTPTVVIKSAETTETKGVSMFDAEELKRIAPPVQTQRKETEDSDLVVSKGPQSTYDARDQDTQKESVQAQTHLPAEQRNQPASETVDSSEIRKAQDTLEQQTIAARGAVEMEKEGEPQLAQSTTLQQEGPKVENGNNDAQIDEKQATEESTQPELPKQPQETAQTAQVGESGHEQNVSMSPNAQGELEARETIHSVIHTSREPGSNNVSTSVSPQMELPEQKNASPSHQNTQNLEALVNQTVEDIEAPLDATALTREKELVKPSDVMSLTPLKKVASGVLGISCPSFPAVKPEDSQEDELIAAATDSAQTAQEPEAQNNPIPENNAQSGSHSEQTPENAKAAVVRQIRRRRVAPILEELQDAVFVPQESAETHRVPVRRRRVKKPLEGVPIDGANNGAEAPAEAVQNQDQPTAEVQQPAQEQPETTDKPNQAATASPALKAKATSAQEKLDAIINNLINLDDFQI